MAVAPKAAGKCHHRGGLRLSLPLNASARVTSQVLCSWFHASTQSTKHSSEIRLLKIQAILFGHVCLSIEPSMLRNPELSRL